MRALRGEIRRIIREELSTAPLNVLAEQLEGKILQLVEKQRGIPLQTENQETSGTVETRVQVSPRAEAVFESRAYAHDHLQEQSGRIRNLASALWAEIDSIAAPPGSEVTRLIALAKTDVESAAMWATKALSRFSPGSSTQTN